MRRRIIPYNPKLKEVARQLRRNGTLAEVILWKHLRGKQMKDHDFHRQKPIDNFIVDFFCSELMLAIEIDGISHDARIEADAERQRRLEALGVRFLRFTERDVRENLEGVLLIIEKWIRSQFDNNTPRPSTTPLKRGYLRRFTDGKTGT